MYVERLRGYDLKVPRQQTVESAGIDLCAAIPAPVTLQAMERKLIPTGFIWAINPGCAGLICPRSGLAYKHGVTVLNGPGVIDSDYRGEVGVLLINLGGEPYTIRCGDRIAQMVVTAVSTLRPALSTSPLGATDRGEGGFGSTGK